MTLKYESELLFGLMKRDGDDAPSDVLPYESELKEKYIEQVEGAYPKLQDYQAEWLNYNLYHHLPSYFPVVSVANVTSASFDNVVPYAYISAILKGQTLVNLLDMNNLNQVEASTYVVPLTSMKSEITIIATNKTADKSPRVSLYNENGTWLRNEDTSFTNNKIHYTTESGVYIKELVFKTDGSTTEPFSYASVEQFREQGYVVIEGNYENGVPSYFEGMQSVKMPVLTTSNGFEIFKTGTTLDEFDYNLVKLINGCISIPDSHDAYIKTKKEYTLLPNQSYVVRVIEVTSSDDSSYIIRLKIGDRVLMGVRASLLDEELSKNTYYDIVYTNTTGEPITGVIHIDSYFGGYKIDKIYIGEEPFKSNILTVNEDVTLRGGVYINGELKEDILDLISGEYSMSVGETVLNGSENWGVWYHTDTLLRFSFNYPNMSNLTNIKLQCDNFPSYGYNQDAEGLYGNDGKICLIIDNSNNKLLGNTVNDLKTYLSQNPITVQYPLKEKSIKTVDLTCINEHGESVAFRPLEGTMHVSTSSQTLPPLLDMTVPVEATTQNLMSFVNIVVVE